MAHGTLRTLLLLSLATLNLVFSLDNAYIANYKLQLQQRKRLETVSLDLSTSKTTSGDLVNSPAAAAVDVVKPPVTDVNGNVIPNYNVFYYFDQLVDHKNPKLGTFRQRYYHTWEYYRPGGPIFLYSPGEASIARQSGPLELTNMTMQGALAQQTGGAVISLEHRFYGTSQPLPDDTTSARFKYLTIEQAMDDFVYFANNVHLAMPGGATEAIRPHKVPWVFVGGSYSGALAAWIMEQRPGVFWASYSSSGVVQTMLDFWQYYTPMEKYMPANCTADVKAVISFVDEVIDSGNATTIRRLQSLFALEDLSVTDFTWALTQVLDWQDLDITGRGRSLIYDFCDHLEVDRLGRTAPATGFGLDYALQAWSFWYSATDGLVAYLCQGARDIHECLSLDGSEYLKSPVEDDNRAWIFQVCNELGFLQVGPPEGGGIVSKHYRPEAWPKFCDDAFPDLGFTDSLSAFQARVDKTSEKYKGWQTNADRVYVVNGRRDPWVESTLSAEAARVPTRASRPIALADGFHCSDLSLNNALRDPSLEAVWKDALQVIPGWLKEFTPSDKPKTGGSSSSSGVRLGTSVWFVGTLVGVISSVLLV